jgi:hypothetical protein
MCMCNADPCAYRNFFSFFLFFFDSSYVGFVPVSDVLAISSLIGDESFRQCFGS